MSVLVSGDPCVTNRAPPKYVQFRPQEQVARSVRLFCPGLHQTRSTSLYVAYTIKAEKLQAFPAGISLLHRLRKPANGTYRESESEEGNSFPYFIPIGPRQLHTRISGHVSGNKRLI